MRRGRRTAPVVVVVVMGVAVLLLSATARPARAEGGDGAVQSRRAGWATLLIAYTAVGALATGGAYLWRDNFFGRSIAVTAGAWGGGSVGAGAAYGLAHLAACRVPDCEEERAMPAFVGAFLGGVAGSLVSTWQTSQPGMSRPTVTAIGAAPFFLFASLGTIFDW